MKTTSKLSMFFLFLFTSVTLGYTQQADPPGGKRDFIAVCVGFYNVENLFDTINDPRTLDEEFTPEGLNRWNSVRYHEKIENLARVIAEIGTDMTPDGPAVLGLSEVENELVLEDLASHPMIKNRDYRVVHYYGPDARGVDVAFFYQPRYFSYISSKSYRLHIPGRPDFRTRDQLLMTGEMLGERMHFIVAHYPSRRGGERRSRPLRIATADLTRHIADSILQAEPGAKIVFMGDVNDNPTDVSIRKHLRSVGSRQHVKENEFFNPFESLYRRGIGSNAWRDSWSLFDQILVSPGLLEEKPRAWQFFRAEVFNKPFMRQPSGRFQGYPYRSYAGGVYLGGYSDHFPTMIYLVREK